MRWTYFLLATLAATAYADDTSALIAKLSDPKVDVRVSAAQALERVKDEARLAPLEKAAMSDPEPRVRYQALYSLGSELVGQAPRWKALRLGALKDKDGSVRNLAASQLKGQPDAIEPILAVLKTERDYNYRNQMIVGLDAHDRRVVDYLLTILPVKDGRLVVLQHLGSSGDPRVVDPLIKAARDRWDGAIGAMSRTNDPRALAVVVELVADKDPATYREAINLLAAHPDGRAVAPLLAQWKRLDGRVSARWAARSSQKRGAQRGPSVSRSETRSRRSSRRAEPPAG